MLPLQLPWTSAQTRWKSELDPVIQSPLWQGNQINSIALVASTPMVINHKLGRMMQGWIIVDKNAAAEVYRTQPFNSQTLTLESSANVTVNIWCY